MLVLAAIVYGVLLVAAGVEPSRSRLSSFELKRRQKQPQKTVEIDVLRERHFQTIRACLWVLVGLLLVLFVLLLVAALGWIVGVALAVAGVLGYVAIAHVPSVRTRSQRLYDKYELQLLQFIDQHSRWFTYVRGVAMSLPQPEAKIDSREEFLHVVARSGTLLTTQERQLIESGLGFNEKTVNSIMTPRSVIDSIPKDELLGPLILDELHKTGHSRFPVTDGDIDHVVGVLHLRDMVLLQSKRSVKALTAMKTPVYYIKETQTLQQALGAFLKTHHLLFVVVNEYRETVGIITLEDVIEALLGRKIIDEFDAHEDLRAVATRNPHKNNQPRQHHDV